MTPAKPQHMSSQKDDPDDLIAELAKLMATDGKSSGEGSPQSPSAANEPRPAAGPQTIRIPGMSEPVVTSAPPPGGKFDFGRPATPEPTANWQDRLGSKPAQGADPFAAPAARQEPSIGSGTWRPAIAPSEAEPKAAPPAFDFDFGFNRERPESAPKPEAAASRPALRPAQPASPPAVSAPPAPVPAASSWAQQPVPVSSAPQPQPQAPERDPIAELIAAELNAEVQRADAQRSEAAAPQPVPAPQQPRPMVVAPAAAPVPAAVGPASEPVPARPEPPAPRPQESDKFATAPVFGLGNRPAGEAPAAPKVRLDPMDEIESLIGEAVRVELNMPQAPQPVRAVEPMSRAQYPQTSPVVPPLNSQFAPRRTTSLREAEASPGADEAILAAAAAAGSEVGRIDSPFGDDRPGRQKKQSRREAKAEHLPSRRERAARDDRQSGGAFKQLVVPIFAGAILVAGGFGLYWYLGMGHYDGRAPILSADATPAKTIPAKPADSSAPHSVVMEQLSGAAPAASKETLVSRDQTAGAAGAEVADQPGTSNASDSGLANRKVRTVTVRPDGTIVSSDDSVAGAAKLPVDRPNVPAVPGVSVASANENAPRTTPPTTTDAAPATDDSSTLASVGLTPSPTAAPPATVDVASVPNEAAPTAAADPNAPIPLPRPAREAQASVAAADSGQFSTSRPSSSVNAVVRNNAAGAKPMDLIGNLASSSDASANDGPQAAAASPKAPQAAVASTTGGSVAHVQLSSQPSQAGAQSSANTLQKRFGNLFGGGQLQIVKVDLSKGTYYRVVLPTSSLQAAQQLCASIKAGGGACVAANG